MFLKRMAAAACCLIVVCSLSGCGGGVKGRSGVQGTVKFDGQPIPEGVIAFIPIGTTVGPSSGATIKNGKYSIAAEQGPVLGTHRVEITASRTSGTKQVKGLGEGTGGPSGGGSVTVLEMYIPAQYNKKSKLEFVVKAGSSDANFDLTSK
ncbi:MAG: hypothetical protein V4719_16785 [Planctomycetota bacterium]